MPTTLLQPYSPVTNPQSLGVGLGAITGLVFAFPQRTRPSTLSVQIVFGADPGAYVYAIMVSDDGVNFTQHSQITGTTVNGQSNIPDFGHLFVRVDQVSKTNGVATTVLLKS